MLMLMFISFFLTRMIRVFGDHLAKDVPDAGKGDAK
jgi:hypothetical protein